MDFETYSEAGYDIGLKVKGIGPQGKGGLGAVGTPVYAAHPSAEVLCLYYDLKDGKGRRPWLPGTPDPHDLLQHVAAGGRIEGWNVTFEFWIWNMVCVRRYGWPPLAIEQCYCAMAKARRYSLPAALDKAAAVLNTPRKDKAGKALLNKLTRPHTPTKTRAAHRWTTATAWPDFAALYEYCDQDVVAEDGASACIPEMTEQERATWLMDQKINARGVAVDVPSLDAMLDILGQTERKYTLELATLTGGAVGSVSEVAKLGTWLGHVHAVHMPDLTKDTVAEFLARDSLPAPARWALEIRQKLGAANVKKLRTLKLQVSSDGRLRDQYKYCGADRTGRWAAGGVQLQNITAKGPRTAQCESCGKYFGNCDTSTPKCPRCGSWMWHVLRKGEWPVEAVEQALADIATRDLARVEQVWSDPIALLCGCLRGLFTASEGKELLCCDFSAIEAVVAACLARCQWRIDIFSGDGKIYEQSAANATGIPLDEILEHKRTTGEHHPARKGVGKIRELAGGYGGWIGAWKNFGAEEYFANDDEIKADVLKWREESPEIVEMWGGQYAWCGPGKWDYRPELFGLEGAAISAILNPGRTFEYYDISYHVAGDVLRCRLPSGRYLNYHRPRLATVNDKLNRGPAYQITFEGYNSNAAKGAVGWFRLETYAGRLFENVVQAVALDIQAEAMLRLEAAGYPLVMHTHDEAVAELPEGLGSVEEMEHIMSVRPEWAAWWPIRAAGWKHKRYQKD
jgi:DNA polymerase